MGNVSPLPLYAWTVARNCPEDSCKGAPCLFFQGCAEQGSFSGCCCCSQQWGVSKVLQARPGHKGNRASRVNEVCRGHRASRECRDLKEYRGARASRAHREYRVNKVRQDHEARKARLESKDQKGQRVTRAMLGLRAQLRRLFCRLSQPRHCRRQPLLRANGLHPTSGII